MVFLCFFSYFDLRDQYMNRSVTHSNRPHRISAAFTRGSPGGIFDRKSREAKRLRKERSTRRSIAEEQRKEAAQGSTIAIADNLPGVDAMWLGYDR